MSETKVYVINIDAQDDMRTILTRREALGIRIATLARHTGDAFWFHDFADDTLGGAACILLECNESLMDHIRRMPGYASDHPVWQDVQTQRSPALQAYYSRPATPAPRP